MWHRYLQAHRIIHRGRSAGPRLDGDGGEELLAGFDGELGHRDVGRARALVRVHPEDLAMGGKAISLQAALL